MNEVVVRPWKESDLDSVRRITWETWLATYTAFVPEEDLRSYFDREYSLESLQTFFRAKSTGGFLALIQSTPAGYVRTRLDERDGRFYVTSLYVLPKYQGKGVGSLLLQSAEHSAAASGAPAVWLGVMTANTRTVAWYRKIGFVFVEEQPFTMGNTTVPHLIGYKTRG